MTKQKPAFSGWFLFAMDPAYLVAALYSAILVAIKLSGLTSPLLTMLSMWMNTFLGIQYESTERSISWGVAVLVSASVMAWRRNGSRSSINLEKGVRYARPTKNWLVTVVIAMYPPEVGLGTIKYTPNAATTITAPTNAPKTIFLFIHTSISKLLLG